MLTVLGIIALLLAISIPGMTSMWEERKVAQAVTMVRGLLMSTRAQALRSSERGLFFYIDPVTGAQRIAPIIADPPRDVNPAVPGFQENDYGGNQTYPMTDVLAVNRFIVAAGDIYTLPAPVRVTPRALVDDDGAAPPNPDWPETDITWGKYSRLNTSATATTSLDYCRHRNFFAVVFGPDGRMLVGRDVLIHDADEQPVTAVGAASGDEKGDRTGLFVEQADLYFTNVIPAVAPYTLPVDPTGGGGKLLDMVVDEGTTPYSAGSKTALNFPSVDGLLVYDDSILADIPEDTVTPNGLGTLGKRGYLIKEGLPIYVSRLTGEVLEGPKGEAQ